MRTQISAAVSVVMVLTLAWIATAQQAEAKFAQNPSTMAKAIHIVSQTATHQSEPALRNALARTHVVATSGYCQIRQNVPVQGYAYYDRVAGRPVVCVSNWSSGKAQQLIVWAHEIAHILELFRKADHFAHPHDMSHYNTAYDVLTMVIDLAEMHPSDKIRLRIYYRMGTAIAPFTDWF